MLARGKHAEKATTADDEEEYDPVAHRPEGRPLTTDFDALMHLMKCSIGTGILFLPNAFRRTGYLMSLLCSIFIGLLCTTRVVGLVRCSQLLCRRNRIPMLDFAGTAEVAFQNGPEQVRKYARIFRIVTIIFTCFSQYQCTVVYILYVSTSFQQVIEFASGVELNVRVYILCVFPIACCLGFVTNLKLLAPFSTIGFVFVLSGVCISIYYFLEDFPDPGRLNKFTQVLPVPMYCSIFLFAMHNTTYCMPLENSMKNPTHLPRLLTFSMMFNMCLYTIFGLLGYNKYDSATCDTVIKNLPLDQPLAQMVKVAVSLSVMFSFGLAFFVPHNLLWRLLEPKFPDKKYYYALLRIVAVIGSTLIAIAVPEMVPLLGFLASLSITTIMLLIPTLIETATKWNYATRFLIVRNICICFIWLFLLIFGATESLLTIIAEYQETKVEGC